MSKEHIGCEDLPDDRMKNILSAHIGLENRIKEKLKKESNIPKIYWKYSWKSYQPKNNIRETGDINIPGVVKSRLEAKKKCLLFVRDIISSYKEKDNKDEKNSLCLIGHSGSGKSVLGTLILRNVIHFLKESVFYETFNQLVIDCRTANFKEHAEELFDKYIEPEFLMIDEIERGYYLDEKIKTYISIIIGRRASECRPTILTANIEISEELSNILGVSTYRVLERGSVYYKPIEIDTLVKHKRIDLKKLKKELESEKYNRKYYISREDFSEMTTRCIEGYFHG